jgi:hypothetical protein
MHIYGDIAIRVRLDGAPDPVVELVDRYGRSLRLLQRVPGLEALADAENVPSISLTLDRILAADWDATSKCEGIIPFRARRSDQESFIEWHEQEPRRAPRAWIKGVNAEVVVTEDEALAALAEANDEEAERKLLGDERGQLHVRVKWREKQRDTNEPFVTILRERVIVLGDPERITLTFESLRQA